jgi:DNA (cytosine-5)-methyltransferase 1
MALCAGAGGLELGLRIALGDDYRCVVYVEREAYAAAALVARMADQALDTAPVWDDLSTFDGKPWRGVVDIVSAGFSCQPWSPAGKRLGLDDERWIWPDIERVIREVGPEWVFMENVAGLVRGGLEHVLRDLATQGFAAEWDCVSAAEVDAPHLRERLFILAHRSSE